MPSRILVLEDNKAHMEAMCEILNSLHCDIELHCASNYKEAIQILAEYTIHIFILDIILDTKKPGDTSGIKLAELLRSTAKYKHTPIIFTTSVEDPKLYSYSKLHCFGYIEKPYDPDIVRKTVLEAMDVPVMPDEERYVSFQKDHILYSKQIKEIIYLEITRHEVTVHCVRDELKVPYKSCKEILKDLDSELFIQCNRSTIVNKLYIDCVDYVLKYIRLKNCDTQLELGRVIGKQFEENMEKWFQR